jgi:hypothetical protein
MNFNKILPYGALVFGILAFVTGSVFVVMYVSQAIIAKMGEPDQSLLFWYLPFLFMGIFGIFTGIGLGALGVIGLRRIRSQDKHIDTQTGKKAQEE